MNFELVKYEKECYALAKAFNTFENLLLGRIFIVRTNHSNLLCMQHSINAKVQRWFTYLYIFDFTLEHIPCVDKVVADALFRIFTPISAQNTRPISLLGYLQVPKNKTSVAICRIVPIQVRYVGFGGCLPRVARHELSLHCRQIPSFGDPLGTFNRIVRVSWATIPMPSIKRVFRIFDPLRGIMRNINSCINFRKPCWQERPLTCNAQRHHHVRHHCNDCFSSLTPRAIHSVSVDGHRIIHQLRCHCHCRWV